MKITEQDVLDFVENAKQEIGASMLTTGANRGWYVWDSEHKSETFDTIAECKAWLKSRTPETIKAEKIAKHEAEIAKLKGENQQRD